MELAGTHQPTFFSPGTGGDIHGYLAIYLPDQTNYDCKLHLQYDFDTLYIHTKRANNDQAFIAHLAPKSGPVPGPVPGPPSSDPDIRQGLASSK